jgi:hypothetical protein
LQEEENLKIRLWTVQLYREYDNICFHFRLKLRKPVIVVKPLASHWGTWDPMTRVITINQVLVEKYTWASVIEVLKHEMAHQIVNEVYFIADHTHKDNFKRACALIGMEKWAARADEDLVPDAALNDATLTPEAERILRKAEKLLALASSSNEHEAVAAMERVRQLYQKYNIESFEANAPSDMAYIVINNKKKRIPTHESMICNLLTEHFFVEVVFSSMYDAHDATNYKTIELLGRPQNIRMAEYVYHFLLRSLKHLWLGYKGDSKTLKRRSQNSFYTGVLTGFGEKLTLSSKKLDQTLSPNEKAIILKSDRQISAYCAYRHPRTTTRYWGSRSYDKNSYSAGKREGFNLILNKPIAKRGGSVKLLTN